MRKEMIADRADYGTGTPIVAALEELARTTKQRVEKPHHFRFVSGQQALPFTMAYYRWGTGGQQGAPPTSTATAAEFRAAIYYQSMAAAALAAFYRVACVIAVEFAETAADGFRTGRLTSPCTALRCLIERIAHAASLADAIRNLPAAPIPRETPLKPLFDVSTPIVRALSGTQRDWSKLANADFRKTSHKEVAYAISEEEGSIRAPNIMNSIDKLEKRVRGTRLTYEVLCEFLHPNRGDLFGATVSAQATVDYHGTRHLDRIINFGPKTLIGSPEMQVVIEKVMDVSVDIVSSFSATLDEIQTVSTYATKITREFAHNVANKHYKHLFANRDPCPCLSGLRIRDCARRRAA
jgi:hypothetical protein